MKITCMIPTRRATFIGGCVHALSMLESGEHEVVYSIGVDNDDPASIEAAARCTQTHRASMSLFSRLPALGSYHNQLATAVPADVYTTLGDDVICVSPKWDKAIAEAVEANPRGLWWWDAFDDRKAIYPIVTETWRAVTGRIFTDLFPCWYDDVWIREVGIMVTGFEVPRIEGAKLADCPMATTRMRDMMFWDDFYHATRGARLVEAKAIADKLYPERRLEDMTAVMDTFCPNEEYRATIPEVEETQGDKHPVTASYLVAKERAVTILQTISENA